MTLVAQNSFVNERRQAARMADSPRWQGLRRHAFILPAFAMVMIVCAWFVTWGDWHLLDRERFSGFHDAQARSLLHGRLDVPPDAIGFEAFNRDGKSYGYFGIGPALLRLPLVALFPSMDGRWSRLSILAATFLNLLCAYRLVCGLEEAEQRQSPIHRFIVWLFILCAGLGSTTVFLASRAYAYHEAIAWGGAFALLMTDRLIAYFRSPSRGAWHWPD